MKTNHKQNGVEITASKLEKTQSFTRKRWRLVKYTAAIFFSYGGLRSLLSSQSGHMILKFPCTIMHFPIQIRYDD